MRKRKGFPVDGHPLSQARHHPQLCKCEEAKVPLDGAGTKYIYLLVVERTLAVQILEGTPTE